MGAVAEGVSRALKDPLKLVQSMKLIPSIGSPFRQAGPRGITRCDICGRSLTLRHVSRNNAGIRMGDRWHCSSRCFTRAAQVRFSSELTTGHATSGPLEVQHVLRMPLPLILIRAGWLTREQSRHAMEERALRGGEVGDLLTRLGYVSEKQVTAARAMQWGCPVFAAGNKVVPTEVQIPLTLIRLRSVFPLHYVPATKRLLMGFVHGVEYGLLYTIEQITGCKTEACFLTPGDFRILTEQTELREQTGNSGECGDMPAAKELNFDDILNPAEMARILCSHAVDIEADEAAIGRSRGHVWARLSRGSGNVDLLFRVD